MDFVSDKMDDLVKYLEESEWYDNLDISGQKQVRIWFRTLYAEIRTLRQLERIDPVVKQNELFNN